jgi:glycosyl transferase family 25
MSACNYKIFVINLDSSVSRWRECQKQLENMQLEHVQIERISAIDGRKLSWTELNRHFDTSLNLLEYHKTLTAGEIGCYLSHRKTWAQIITQELDFALVLEDDFIINGQLDQVLSAVASIEQQWHCIKLAEFPIKRKELSSQAIANFRLVNYDKIPARTCAQLISHSGAKSLLTSTQKFGRPVDIDLQHWWEHKLIVFGLKPYPFQINHTSTSDIENIFKRKNSKTRRLSKLFQQMYFYVENQRAIKEVHF